MTLASSLGALFAGPSPGIVAAILVLAACSGAAVLWAFVRLIVDPRARIADDTDEQNRVGWDETDEPAYDDGYAPARGDGTD